MHLLPYEHLFLGVIRLVGHIQDLLPAGPLVAAGPEDQVEDQLVYLH